MVFPPLADRLRRSGIPVAVMTGYDRGALPPAYEDVAVCGNPVTLSSLARQLAAHLAST